MARSPDLERRVLDLLWGGGVWSVRAVMDGVDPTLAYTTFATVLDSLHAKGEADRVKVEGSWRYTAARSREQALAGEVGRVLARVEGAPYRLLVAFLDQVEAADPDAMGRLEALIAARRKGR